MKTPYDDIIHLPHPDPVTRPRMPDQDRAAQFAPFAALTDHAAVLRERTRRTEPRRCLSEDQQAELDRRLVHLRACLPERPQVQVTYFRPDSRKPGGAAVTLSASAQKLDLTRRILTLAGAEPIPLDDLYQLEGDIFRLFE